ncbi:MAG: CBS domain-containing protein, partial [Planctomycetota bacterium]
MTSEVISVSGNVPVQKAVSLLAKNHISCLPVVDRN